MTPTAPENFKMPFGKHKGKSLGDILAEDAAYLDWVRDKIETIPLLEAVSAMCKKYEPEIERAIEDREWRSDGI